MTTSPSAVPAWTAAGHQLSWSGTLVDRHEEHLVDDVVPDAWIHPPRRSPTPTVSTPAPAERPAVAVLR